MKNENNGKKKLSAMSVDEFMEHGLDSDVSLDEDEDEEYTKPTSETSRKEKNTDSKYVLIISL